MNRVIFLVVLLGTSLGFSMKSYGEIADFTNQAGMYLAIEELSESYYLHRYDMDADSKLSSITLDESPTAITSDATDIYLALGQKLYTVAIVNNEATLTLLRNFPQNIEQLVSAGDYLLVLSGDVGQSIFSIRKSDGQLMSSIPGDLELTGTLERIHFSDDYDLVYAKYSAAVSSSLIIANAFDSTTGLFGAENTIDGGDIAEFETPFFLSDLDLVVDSAGRVVAYNASTIVETVPKETSLASFDFITTDETFKAVASGAANFYVAATIDNACHEFNPGTRIRRWYENGTTDLEIDSPEDIHSMVVYGDDLFVFWGEGTNFDGDISSDITQPEDDTSEFNPNNHDFDPDYHKSAMSRDGTQLIMQVDDGCEHHIVRWDTTTHEYIDSVEIFWTTDDFSYSEAQNRVYLASSFDDGFFLYYVDFDDATPARTPAGDYSYAGSFGQMVATDNQLVFQATVDDGNPLNVIIANETSFTDADLAGCCETWTNAEWDPNEKRIVYTTDEGMFEMVMTEPGDLVSPVTFSTPTQSLYYGSSATANADGEIAFSENGDLLFYRGIIYDSATLDFVDSVVGLAEMAAWIDGDLYTLISGGNVMEKWQFNQGADNHIGLAESVDLSNFNSLLFPMENEGVTIPLSVTVSSGKALTYREHVSDSEVNSTTVGGNGSTSSGGTDDSADDSPSEPVGGTGGGSIGYAWLLVLMLGIWSRSRG